MITLISFIFTVCFICIIFTGIFISFIFFIRIVCLILTIVSIYLICVYITYNTIGGAGTSVCSI